MHDFYSLTQDGYQTGRRSTYYHDLFYSEGGILNRHELQKLSSGSIELRINTVIT